MLCALLRHCLVLRLMLKYDPENTGTFADTPPVINAADAAFTIDGIC